MTSIGVDVVTRLQSGPSNPGARSGRFHIGGLTERGPVDRAAVTRSLADFETVYGGRTAYTNSMFDTARMFFEEGGSELVVSRAVGPSATKGNLILNAATPTSVSAPVLSAPTTATTGGSLAAATYFYKATYTNAAGETVGSNEVSQVTTGTTSTVTFTIGAAPAGATGTKIYRSTTTGTQVLLDTLTTTPTTYTDNGSKTPGTATVPTVGTATTPSPTLKIEALDPGPHSVNLSAEVIVSGATFTLNIYENAVRVSQYANMASPAAVATAATTNAYVKITDLGSPSAAPGNNPGALAITPLSLGSDDRGAVTAAIVVGALASAGELAAGGAVAAPGYGADLIGSLLLDHAYATRKVALLAMDEDSTSAEATGQATTLGAHARAEYGGLFFPHLVVRDGTGTRTVSPEGYVAAVRARAAQEVGYWQVPAGDRARTRWVLATTSTVDVDLNNTLAAGNVNGITTTGTKVRLYNWSSLSTNRADLGLLSARDVLNNLTIAVKEALEPYVFSTLDGRGHLLGYVESAVVGVLDPIARRGGFYANLVDGEQVDPGYRVIVDQTNNSPDTLSQNEVRVNVSVRLSPTAALIRAEIIKVPLTAAV